MSEATTTSSMGPLHSPASRRKAMRTRNGMSTEVKQAIAREAAGKNGKELIVLAAKHGVSRSSLELWRKTWGIPGAPPSKTVEHGKATSPATKREVLARWRASGQSPHAWGKANGYGASTLYGWLGRKGAASRKNAASLRPQGGGRADGRANYSEETKRQIVERSRHELTSDIARETGISVHNIQRWRRDAGLTALGRNQHARAPVETPSALSTDDQALLEGHDQQKTRDKNLLERVRRLEKENLVLKANLAYAMEAGYLDLFNMDRMFTGKKG